jgi:hypothetical protein
MIVFRYIGLAFTSLLLGAAPALSLPIAVANAGFEDPILAEPDSTDDDLPGWIGAGGVLVASNFGAFNPPASFFPAEAPEGVNVAYIQDGEIGQPLSDTLERGAYTLSVRVGQSLVDVPSPFRVQLWAGTTLLAEETAPIATAGEFAEVVVQYGASESDPELGSLLEIVLVDDGVPGQFADEPYFDDVRLDFEPVPEPSAALLLLAGATALALARLQALRTGPAIHLLASSSTRAPSIVR